MSGGAVTDYDAVVEVLNPNGAGPVLILCEHASSHIPTRYDGLGLTDGARTSHAAWDPGARAMALLLSAALDAPLVASCVSRLVYDCNRPPEAPAAMPDKSERIEVPGNRNLTQAQRDERTLSTYRPFCAAVDDVLTTHTLTTLITIHSFTPIYHGKPRDVEIGILHDDDSRLADAMLAQSPLLPQRNIQRNQPYRAADGVTHSLKLHGQSNGLANVMIELRNDLLVTPQDQENMVQELLILLNPALATLSLTPKGAARA